MDYYRITTYKYSKTDLETTCHERLIARGHRTFYPSDHLSSAISDHIFLFPSELGAWTAVAAFHSAFRAGQPESGSCWLGAQLWRQYCHQQQWRTKGGMVWYSMVSGFMCPVLFTAQIQSRLGLPFTTALIEGIWCWSGMIFLLLWP